MQKPLNKILLVDDDRFIRAVAEKALALGGGFSVQLAEDGRQGLVRAATWRPDLILLDVVMPGLDGPATLRALRSRPETAHIPVMFVTARTQEHQVEALRGLGALAILSKPFDPATFAATVRDRWAEHFGRQATPADGLATELNVLRHQYAEAVPAQVRGLHAQWAQARAGAVDALTALHRSVHSINGSGASFGFTGLTTAAGALESALDEALEAPGRMDTAFRQRVARLLQELQDAAEHLDAAASIPPEALPAPEAPADGEPRPRVLVVDDMAAVRQRLRAAMQASGFDTLEAADGVEAVEQATEHRPDLILMDVMMPRMNGFEAHRALRAVPGLQQTPVLFMTTTQKINLQQVQEALSYGASGYLPKSMPLAEIVREVRDTLARRAA